MQTFFDNLDLSEIIENETEFIPLMSPQDEERMNREGVPDILSILPLRNTVLFPGVVIPITVGRDKSIKLINEAYKKKMPIGVVAQIDQEIEDPHEQDLHRVGTMASVMKVLQMPDGNTTAIIQGKRRFRIEHLISDEPYLTARVSPIPNKRVPRKDQEFDMMLSTMKDLSTQIIKKSPNIPSEATFALNNIESPSFLLNFISSNLNVELSDKQSVLEIEDIKDRASRVLQLLSRELQVLELKNQIQNKVKLDIDKQQRDYFLHQQLKTIQEELGGMPHEQEIKELQQKAASKKWPAKAAQAFEREMAKLQRMNPSVAEYSIQMNYLETLIELPWEEYSKDDFDLRKARRILDEDHFGLEKVKERIVEHLAVLKLKGDMKSPILCLAGPPGVGKTSLGKSVARALGRSYVRMSLGGVRDEAEIRGHRKTYIGAMPGRIIQNIRKAKTSNPIFVLDEIDKIIGANINGDPSAALLEVLDPEQNSTFYDNFLEVEYDLSKVLFIATANNLAYVHPALLDRMEVIEISGYLPEEKIEIAKRHLIPKQLGEHGLKTSQVKFKEDVLADIIDNYTRESGVRGLEKNIAKIMRHRAKDVVSEFSFKPLLKPSDLEAILGVPRFQKEKRGTFRMPGIVTGLAWTSFGGDILFVEASISKGKGRLTLTGNLGEVMKESASLAYEYLKAHSALLMLEADHFDNWNVHIHVPEGATPKDGPSAGITMFTALASVFTQRRAHSNIAMTGEITLRGRVLPVGGIKEKILAAKRAGIDTIILSGENRKDIMEVEEAYRSGLSFIYVGEMKEVLEHALEPAASKEQIEQDNQDDLYRPTE
jgi:ATP-dependent Lon protease